jgi:hypothetical protein
MQNLSCPPPTAFLKFSKKYEAVKNGTTKYIQYILVTRVSQCLSPRSNWDPRPPFPQANVYPPGTKRLGDQRGRGRLGGPKSDDWRNSLALCLRCERYLYYILAANTICLSVGLKRWAIGYQILTNH